MLRLTPVLFVCGVCVCVCSILVSDPTQDLDIYLSTVSGDPDLFVIVATSNPLNVPGPGNYQWAAAAFGDDTLAISHNS